MTPTAGPAVDEQNPWPGLSAFDESAQRFFNGRQEESAALQRMVMLSPLTVLFGASGLGKTSVVQAGLFPLLRKDVLPVYVRLDLRERDAPLMDQVAAALQAAIRHRRVDAPASREGESVWEYLHRPGLELWSEQNQLLTPLFVFDQFEEVFTLGAGNAPAIARFRLDLADLIENRVPAALIAEGQAFESQRYKVLLSFREDFLPAIEGWKRDIPSLMRNRLRLLPMSGEQAHQAVHKTAPHLAPEAVAWRIVSFVAAAGDDTGERQGDREVAPALLSLVCHGLNERRKEQRKAQFDEALLTGTGQAIVADFYGNAVAGLPEHVERFIERELITERGFRKPCDVDDARTLHSVTNSDLALLVDRRVLRIEPVRGGERVELTHDLLTRVVREHRDRRREQDRHSRERRRRLTMAGVSLGIIASILGAAYLWANGEKQRALAQADYQHHLATEAKQNADKEIVLKTRAETQTTIARAATLEAERQTRAALGHLLAGAAIGAGGTSTALLFALNAMAVTRDTDHIVLADAQDALRQAVEAVHRSQAPQPTLFDRPGHTTNIRNFNFDFNADGNFVSTQGEPGDGVRVWNLKQNDQVFHLSEGCAILVFSRDGKQLACGNPPFGYFWDVETGNQKFHVGGFRARAPAIELTQMGFSPNGRLMMWATPRETMISDGAAFQKTFAGGNGVFSPDGKLLATFVEKGIMLWDVQSGVEAGTLQGKADRVLFSDANHLLVASEDDSVRVWDVRQNVVTRLEGNSGILPRGCAAFSPDKTRLFFKPRLGSELGWVARMPTGEVTFGSGQTLGDVCQPDGEGLSFKEQGPVAIVENLRSHTTRILPAADTDLHTAAFSADGARAVTSGNDSRARVWDTATGRRLLTLVGHQLPIYTVAFSPDGNRISTAGMDSAAKLWDARTGRFLRDLDARSDRILEVTFSPDSKRIAVVGNGNFTLWDATSAADLTKTPPIYQATDVFSAAFSGDGKLLALTGANQVKVVDAASFSEILRVPFSWGSPGGTAISRDGQFLAVAASTGVQLWQKSSGWKLLADSRPGERSSQIGFAFTRDGKHLITPGTGNTIQLWDSQSGKQLAKLYCDTLDPGSRAARDMKIRAVAFTPDEKRILAVSDAWMLYRADTPADTAIAEARRLAAGSSLTDKNCELYLHQTPCPVQLHRKLSTSFQ